MACSRENFTFTPNWNTRSGMEPEGSVDEKGVGTTKHWGPQKQESVRETK
jgi:hypothetical protein